MFDRVLNAPLQEGEQSWQHLCNLTLNKQSHVAVRLYGQGILFLLFNANDEMDIEKFQDL